MAMLLSYPSGVSLNEFFSSTGDNRRRPRLPSHRRLRLAFFIAAFLIDAASAADWSVVSTVSERMEADDNIDVVPSSPGYVVGSITGLETTISAEMPTHILKFDTDLELRRFGGPGATGELDAFNPTASLSVSKQTKLTAYEIFASISRRNASSVEFEDTGRTTVDTDRLDYLIRANATHRVNESNSLSILADAELVDFIDDAGLTPYFATNLDVTWAHEINARTIATLGAEFGYFAADDDRNRTEISLAPTIGVSHRLTKRIAINGSIGPSFALNRQDALFPATPAVDELTVGYTGDLELRYRRKRTNISLGLRQGLEPSSLGELLNRSSATFALDHQMDRYSSFNFNTTVSSQESQSNAGGNSGTRQTLIIETGLTRRLARNWQGELGYTFRYSDADGVTASSNKVWLSISRTFDILQ
jgi:hypothetical protein